MPVKKPALEEQHVISRLNKCGKPIIVGLNKIDITKGKFVPEYIKLWEETRGVPMTEMKDLILFPLSALKGTNVKKLVDLLFEQMPQGPFYILKMRSRIFPNAWPWRI